MGAFEEIVAVVPDTAAPEAAQTGSFKYTY
jgi:hypothetical protein